MKKNVKGFMLAETLVVASFISVTLLFLFVQFRTVIKNFNESSKYNTVNALYVTNEIKNYLKENDFQAITIELENSSKGYVDISSCTSVFFSDPVYCQELMRKANVNKVIYISGKNPTIGSEFSKDFTRFMERNIDDKEDIYYLFSEFQDGSYAVLKMNGYYFPTITEKVTENSIYIFGNNTADGLYVDNYKDDLRYIYRGSNPNNYISFNDEIWRIVSIEENGVKIIGPKLLSSTWDFDKNYFIKSSLLQTGSYDVENNKNSAAFERLNFDYDLDKTTGEDNGYYGQISTVYQNFINENIPFNIGTIPYNTSFTLEEINSLELERTYSSSKGHLGFINVSDYVKASLNASCLETPLENSNCTNQNWLNNTMWTINASEEGKVYIINETNGIVSEEVTDSFSFYPVLYLNSNVRLTGEGTLENPYTIIKEN